jgi:hypothetical protein
MKQKFIIHLFGNINHDSMLMKRNEKFSIIKPICFAPFYKQFEYIWVIEFLSGFFIKFTSFKSSNIHNAQFIIYVKSPQPKLKLKSSLNTFSYFFIFNEKNSFER